MTIRRLTAISGLLAAFCVLGGCSSYRYVPGTNTQASESVRIVEHTELVPVLVKVEIPEISERVTVKDSVSHLENRFAVSEARVHRDGTLSHSLMTKPQEIEKEAQVQVEHKDSIVSRDREVEKVVEVKVEKSLNWWQGFRMWAFWPLLGFLVLAYRKQIFKLIKLLV